jgi:hypothetical protein
MITQAALPNVPLTCRIGTPPTRQREMTMKLDMEFEIPKGETRSAMRIVLNPVGESPLTGLPLVIQNCTSLDELEAQLQQIEKQLGKIRKEAAKFFKAKF